MFAKQTVRVGILSSNLALRSLMQQSLLGRVACAGFAKYDRNKPHLNVGTIGKWSKEEFE